jgi:hypothetical protein
VVNLALTSKLNTFKDKCYKAHANQSKNYLENLLAGIFDKILQNNHLMTDFYDKVFNSLQQNNKK